MYASQKSRTKLPPIAQSPEEDPDDEFGDAISEISNSSWKSGNSNQRYSTASDDEHSNASVNSLNNNHPQTRPTTTNTQNTTHHHHQATCHKHGKGHHVCSCIKSFYEDDEVCRINDEGRLEFGIVTKHENNHIKLLWTLGNAVEEEDVTDTDQDATQHLRLVDRKAVPGDIVNVHRKRGEVIEVSWTCHLLVLENNMSLLNVPCDNLEPLVPHYPGQKIEYSGWVGTITSVKTEATLMFTGIGKTGVVDCSRLPARQQPYPGRQVRYTVDQYLQAKLRLLDEKKSVSKVFKGYLVVEAFVMFLNVADVQVSWSGRIRLVAPTASSYDKSSSTSVSPTTMPPTTLTKTDLKKHANVLGQIQDVDWDQACHEAVEKYFQYKAKDTDLGLPDREVEEYMKSKYFDEGEDKHSCLSVKELREKGNKICTNVAYTAKVVRFCRMLKVKWSVSGKIEKIPASAITSKKSFNQPFHQLVQKSLTLSPYSQDEYGITLSRNSNDIVLVQWVAKVRENSKGPSKFTFQPTYRTPEPEYNLEPHFAFGEVTPREIVFRSVYCRIPEALFTIGWVRSITDQGQVIVVSVHTKQEHTLYPPEVEASGLKVHDDLDQPTKFKVSRYTNPVKNHGLQLLLRADKIFVQNLSIQDSSYFPEHFTLLQKCPTKHTFYKNAFSVRSDSIWMKAVKKDQLFLTTRMNEEIGSIWIKGFRDRLDLFSVLMAAPPGTPYEGGLYSLDLQLVYGYPSQAPAIYLHTAAGQLRPGTQHLELQDNVRAPHSLVDSLIALQCKLFTSSDPFEIPSSAASLQRRSVITKDSEDRLINAHIIIDVLDLMFRMVMDPPTLWSIEIINYFHMTFDRNKQRLLTLLEVTNPEPSNDQDWIVPTFPLMPVSDGFTEAVLTRLKRFEELLEKSAT